jgi:hypothetical protein
MTYYDMNQQSGVQNPGQWGWTNPQIAQMFAQPGLAIPGIGQPAYAPQYGQPAGGYSGQFGQPNIGALGQGIWGQGTGWGVQPPAYGQRQLTQQDVGEVVRQLVPLLPQIVAQAQQPMAAFSGVGYGPYQQRLLTQQDVNEVVRQILPILPQIVGALQGQVPLHVAAMYGGQGFAGQSPLSPTFVGQNPYAQHPMGQTFINQPPLGQFGWPAFQSAFGSPQNWGPTQLQRHLTPQEVTEVVRQLVSAIPQVIGNLQAYSQQRTI